MEPVTVIINVFNEVETIEREIRQIHSKIVSRIPGSELIVAEDGSSDGTPEVIQRLVAELGVRHSTGLERKGYTQAFRDAIGLAKNSWVFFSDTGGKNDFADFWKLYEAREDTDLVIGSRRARQDQFYRRCLTRAYNRLLQIYFGVPTNDADSGFRLYRASILQKVARQNWINKDLISSEIVVRMHYMGARLKEVPVGYFRRQGTSRGLPVTRIPKVIFQVIKNFPRLKQDARKLEKLTLAK